MSADFSVCVSLCKIVCLCELYEIISSLDQLTVPVAPKQEEHINIRTPYVYFLINTLHMSICDNYLAKQNTLSWSE